MKFSPLIDNLIDALKVLPGVGAKSAQRMAFSLLERDREGALKLAEALDLGMRKIANCGQCRTLTEQPLCHICQNEKRRQNGVVCVVETPADLLAIESSNQFSGTYFVLMGHLSPLDGIGPEALGFDLLEGQLESGAINELILATNPTVEGEATAHYLAQLTKKYDVVVSRIAHGVPIGGELEFVDGMTLAHSFSGRQRL